VDPVQTVFDPLVDAKDKQKATYEFAEYQPQRYELSDLMNSVRHYAKQPDTPSGTPSDTSG